MAKRSSDHWVTYPEVKVPVRDIVRVPRKFVLSRNPEYKTRGVATWLNVVLTPG